MTIPRKYRKLFQDSIVVEIPINETKTADLGVVVKASRKKRIAAILETFPSLNKKQQQALPDDENNKEAHDDDAPEEEKSQEEDDEEPARKRAKVVDETLPQREQYGSVVDYLEAKYVRGVMLGDDIENDDEKEASDTKESVYDSEDSWIDDSLLKRDVAEQVLSHSTQTKVGNTENNSDEDEFFVNVGNLEVENEEILDYDLAAEEEATSSAKKVKKRKRDAGSSKSTGKAKSTPKKKTDDTSSDSKKEAASAGAKKEGESQELGALKQKVQDLQESVKELYDRLVSEIKQMSKEDLPQREKNIQVAVTVSEGKNPGDEITFGNPHVPGQRLRVQVPKGKKPGDTFKVSIPAPTILSDADNNKFQREFQELAAEYATMFDLMCQAEAEYHAADPEQKGKYPLKAKKIAKFDQVAKAFPSNLLTPVDAAYMKKIVRRARQNKKKRKEAPDDDVATAAIAKPAKADPASKKPKVDVKAMPKAKKLNLLKAVKPAPQPEAAKPNTIEIVLPSKGQEFPQKELVLDEFDGLTRE